MSRFFALTFIFLSLFKSPCEGQEDIIRQFTQEAADSLTAIFLLDTPWLTSEATLLRSLDADKEMNFFVQERLEKSFASEKSEHQTQEVIAQERSYLIEFNIIKFALALDFLISEHQIQAIGDIVGFFRITDPRESRVLKEKEYKLKYEQYYPTINLARKMSQNPTALIDEKTSRGASIVEPILLSGVTGIVIYLFYALRSQ